MMRSLYSGVAGLRTHQTRMDVIGNNIANVNTIGYKTSRTVFQDIFSQSLKTASTGNANVGGTNPSQIGLGVALATIDIIFTTGAPQMTYNPYDLSIDGDGLFVVEGLRGPNYTRAGDFYFDNAGNLVTSDGYYVLGYMAADPTASPITWTGEGVSGASGTPDRINVSNYTNMSFDDEGIIWGLEIDPNTGAVVNDKKVPIAKLALATFQNYNGLEKVGGNLYAATGNSGDAYITSAKTATTGTLKPGSLEMSNVDLASEFTDMIVTQRGFQANSRIITTSDTMLEELVNLKR